MRPYVKKILIIFLMLASLTFFVAELNVYADDYDDVDAVYFASRFCTSCQRIDEEKILDPLIDDGYHIEILYLEDETIHTKTLYDFQYTYDVEFFGTKLTPIIFVGDTYFVGYEDIKEAVSSQEMKTIMDQETLLDIKTAPNADFSLIGFVLLGFVDGVNPCAIAMLLLFISMLSFSNKPKTMIKISLIYISAIFISYFLFGTILYQSLSKLSGLAPILEIIPWIIVGISVIVVCLNLYDFIVTYFKKYHKVKNQLPSRIQNFNKKLMHTFTEKLESGSLWVYAIAFLIGVIISFTEFLCTGQAYFTAILHLIHFSNNVNKGILLLVIYNLIFVLPLMIIAVIAAKTQSIMSISSFMRKHLHWIKLFNVIVFLAIIIYYIIFVL